LPDTVTAILLAAGVGRRMGPGAQPKCLVPISGQSLLQRTLSSLRIIGVQHVVLVVGYAAADVVAEARAHARTLRLTVIDNPRYREGAILSLWAAREQFTGDLLIMDADVLYPSVALERLVCSRHRNCLLVDRRSKDTGEEQLVFGQGDRVCHIAKHPSADLRQRFECFGESIGFLKVARADAPCLRALLEAHVQAGDVTAEHEQVYPEFFRAVPVGYERIDDLFWIEIDTLDDVRRAEREVLPQWASPRCLNRVMAQWGLPWVARLPVTPNGWTSLSLGLGLFADWCFAQGAGVWPLLGAAAFQAFYIVDHWDGEVARLKGLSTRWGGWYDVLVDMVVHVGFPVGLAAGIQRSGVGPSWVVLVGWVAAVGLALDFSATLWTKRLGFGPAVYGDPSRGIGVETAPSLGRWVLINLTQENTSLLVVVAVVAGWQLPLLVALAVGSQLFWVSYLWRARARLGWVRS